MIRTIITSGYTDGYIVGLDGKTGNRGICVYDYNDETYELKLISENADSENPSFLHYGKKGVIAACEKVGVCHVEGYRWNTGMRLEKAGSVAVPGTAMCHLTVWPGEKFASASNYMTGDFAVIRLEDGIRPIGLLGHYEHHGVGYDSLSRQEGPHVHSTVVSPGGNYLLVADLGLDQVFVYKLVNNDGVLEPALENSQLHTPPGEGPRHMTFSRDGKYFYLVTELGCKVFAYSWDEENGTFAHIQTLSLLPEGFEGENLSADIHISADGRFLYASNRGADDIAVFLRDSKSGLLKLLAHHKLDGQGPRNFCLDDQMKFIAVACQNSGELLIYELGKDGIPGKLLAQTEAPQISFCGIMAPLYN